MPEVRRLWRSTGRRRAVIERAQAIGPHRTRVLEVEGEGPLLLLLHGFADSADTWRDLLSELASRGMRAAAPDFPGFGRATGIGRQGDLLEAYDEFVTSAIDVLRSDDRPAIIIGNSMGATVALRAAGERDDVAAVVALAPAGLGFRPSLHHISSALDRLLPVLRITYRIPYPPIVVKSAVASYYRLRLAPGAANAWRFGSHFRGMSEFRRVGVLGRRLMAEVERGCLDIEDLHRPITLVWGSADPVCDLAGADVFVGAVPGTRLVVLPGAGHLPQIDAPADVADVIADVVRAAGLDEGATSTQRFDEQAGEGN